MHVLATMLLSVVVDNPETVIVGGVSLLQWMRIEHRLTKLESAMFGRSLRAIKLGKEDKGNSEDPT